MKVNQVDNDKNDIIASMSDSQMVIGIQKLVADLNREIGFKIQLTHNIRFMLLLDAIERIDKDNPKVKKICNYLRLVENLKTFNYIQRSLRGLDLIMLLGEFGGQKIDMTKIIKELLLENKSN